MYVYPTNAQACKVSDRYSDLPVFGLASKYIGEGFEEIEIIPRLLLS